jgi:hypothetical protein
MADPNETTNLVNEITGTDGAHAATEGLSAGPGRLGPGRRSGAARQRGIPLALDTSYYEA